MTELRRPFELTDDVIARYADAAKDWNPIHFDDDFAQARGLPSRIAHGMISGSIISAMMADRYGEAWLRSGRMTVKFIRPCPPGQHVNATGHAGPDGQIDVMVEDASGQPVIVGRAQPTAGDATTGD